MRKSETRKGLRIIGLLIQVLLLLLFAGCQNGLDTQSYTVAYNENGATGGSVPDDGTIYAEGAVVTVLGNTGNLEKQSYTFAGWNTTSDGSGGTYQGGSILVVGISDITLYALWIDETTDNTLRFDANGGGGTMDPLTGESGETITLPTSSFSKKEYEFYGWSDSATGVISYSDGGNFTFGTTDEVLYARWINENDFTYSETGGEITITEYTGNDEDVIIPESINGYPVTAIGDSAFYNCTSLASVTIPDSVTTIGISAFYSCTSLASLTIPDSVTTIDNSAFYNCPSLASVTIPDSVTTIGTYAFHNCTSFYSMTIPDSVTTIGDCAFSHCSNLTTMTIGDSVTTIGFEVFAYCSNLTAMTVNAVSSPSLGSGVFDWCSNLTAIYVPASDDESILNSYKTAWADYADIIYEQS